MENVRKGKFIDERKKEISLINIKRSIFFFQSSLNTIDKASCTRSAALFSCECIGSNSSK